MSFASLRSSDCICATATQQQDENDDIESEDDYLLNEKQKDHDDVDDDIGYLVELEMASILDAESNELLVVGLTKEMSD